MVGSRLRPPPASCVRFSSVQITGTTATLSKSGFQIVVVLSGRPCVTGGTVCGWDRQNRPAGQLPRDAGTRGTGEVTPGPRRSHPFCRRRRAARARHCQRHRAQPQGGAGVDMVTHIGFFSHKIPTGSLLWLHKSTYAVC